MLSRVCIVQPNLATSCKLHLLSEMLHWRIISNCRNLQTISSFEFKLISFLMLLFKTGKYLAVLLPWNFTLLKNLHGNFLIFRKANVHESANGMLLHGYWKHLFWQYFASKGFYIWQIWKLCNAKKFPPAFVNFKVPTTLKSSCQTA